MMKLAKTLTQQDALALADTFLDSARLRLTQYRITEAEAATAQAEAAIAQTLYTKAHYK